MIYNFSIYCRILEIFERSENEKNIYNFTWNKKEDAQ